MSMTWFKLHHEIVSVPLRGNGYRKSTLAEIAKAGVNHVSVPLRGNGYRKYHILGTLDDKIELNRFRPLAG